MVEVGWESGLFLTTDYTDYSDFFGLGFACGKNVGGA